MSRKVDLVASIGAGMKEQTAENDRGKRDDGAGGPVRSPSRVGKSFVGGYFQPEVAKQMRMLAVEQGTTVQALTGEALNHLFAAYGKPQIASARE